MCKQLQVFGQLSFTCPVALWTDRTNADMTGCVTNCKFHLCGCLYTSTMSLVSEKKWWLFDPENRSIYSSSQSKHIAQRHLAEMQGVGTLSIIRFCSRYDARWLFWLAMLKKLLITWREPSCCICWRTWYPALVSSRWSGQPCQRISWHRLSQAIIDWMASKWVEGHRCSQSCKGELLSGVSYVYTRQSPSMGLDCRQ